jgi:predicted ATP-dependent serine protease
VSFSYADLKHRVASLQQQRYVIDQLIANQTVNIVVGHSGLGKTPLLVQIGLHIAAGREIFGHNVTQGRVLYIDAESNPHDFLKMEESISTLMKLDSPPAEFHVWSPNWDNNPNVNYTMDLEREINSFRPSVVFIDPIRVFWPDAPKNGDEATRLITRLRQLAKSVGCAFVLLHHPRKENSDAPTVSLENEPQTWFQEASGSFSLTQLADTRLGVVRANGTADILVKGYVRVSGPTPSFYLKRIFDADGEPLGYQNLTGVAVLKPETLKVFQQLPASFQRKEAHRALGGNSDSNTQRVLKELIAAGMIRRVGQGGYAKAVEDVEKAA